MSSDPKLEEQLNRYHVKNRFDVIFNSVCMSLELLKNYKFHLIDSIKMHLDEHLEGQFSYDF